MTLEYLRLAIKDQIRERDSRFPKEAPKYPWTFGGGALSYVLDLPERHLRSVRQHCDFFLGTSFPSQLFMHGAAPEPVDAHHGYSWFGGGVPVEYWASEPALECLNGRPLGVEINGQTVNEVTCLLQRYACNLYRLGLRDGDHVVEIGAGYGGLAETLIKPRPNLRYTIIDLPETLIFSAAFLQTHFPNASCYMYRPGDDPKNIDWDKYQFAFLPNYRADWLRMMPRSQWALNTVSFAEMSRDQLCRYRDLLAETLDGLLVSVNYYGERADGKGVADFLAERFALTPTPAEIIKGLNLSEDQYKQLDCRPTILCLTPGYDAERIRDVVLRDVLYVKHVETTIGDAVRFA